MSTITRIDISHHQLPLDPPFPAAWDSRPRTRFPATIVRVSDDGGRVGLGSGEAMHGFAEFERYFVGKEVLDLDRHAAVLTNVDFHACRPWPVDVALWDLAGKILDRPVWSLLGGTGSRVRAYASTGTHKPTHELVALARTVQELGFPAIKIRFGRRLPASDLEVVRAIRDAVGDALELMVDCNQGWRMPWDVEPGWDLERATEVAVGLEAENVYWMEEPLHRGDYAGHAELRRRVGVRIAGGELTREAHEFRELLERDCLDVYQPDCVCTRGLSGLRHLAHDVAAAGHTFSPHTWGNGIGLLANAHLVAGTVGTPFLEFPFDPPEWSPTRRDFVLTETVDVDGDGWIELGERPGLGCTLDEDALARTASAAATFT